MVAASLGHASARNFWRSPLSNKLRAPALTTIAKPRSSSTSSSRPILDSLENRERLTNSGPDIAHGRQRIAFVENAVENHGDDAIRSCR